MFDLLIKNGLVADGDSEELYRADVAVEGDVISAVAPDISPGRAKRVIDAGGKVAAPGFVDVHSHSDYYLLIDPRARSKILQGVTTEIGGNCGYAAAPMDGETRRLRAKDYKEQFGMDVEWTGLDGYFKALSAMRPSVNFAALIGYNTIRGSVIGLNGRGPGPAEMKAIRETVGRGLDDGALGMSIGIVYPPACFAGREELVQAYSEVARRGKVFTSHIRSEGAELIESLEEVIDVARRSGARLQVSHLKTAGEANWGKLDRAFEMLEGAMEDGVPIMADRYPYLASNTGLSVVLPDSAFEGGRPGLLEALRSEGTRDSFKKAILENHPDAGYWDKVMIAQVRPGGPNADLEGLTVAEAAALRGKDVFELIFGLLAEEEAQVEAIYFVMSQANMDRIIGKPWVMIGSDAGARAADGPLSVGRPHPRAFGTFPKFFKEYVRESGMFTIPEAVKKCSTMACDFFGIKRRGRLRAGSFADITVFDPETIGDTASYPEPDNYPVGMECVIVNGSVAVERGEAKDTGAGRIVTG